MSASTRLWHSTISNKKPQSYEPQRLHGISTCLVGSKTPAQSAPIQDGHDVLIQQLRATDDVPLQRLEDPPIMLPYGAFWEGLEEFWSDLVNELGEIPFGGNEHYHSVMKPSLGD